MSFAYAIQITPRPARERSTVHPMEGTDTRAEAATAAEEARLARAAAAGDGSAFATLYERYAQRAYNLAYRIAGSEADAADAVQDAFLNTMRRLPKLADREQLAFGSYLFTATRNASYDLIQSRQRTQPSEQIPESATPLGSGAGGLGLDPGDPEEDPDRKVLLSAQQEEIRAANMRLPERQREALALRELEELSYDEIASIMGMNRNSVAQLISRAQIGLRDELRGTALASVAASSPQCERALPLIAMRDDGQLEAGSGDAAWLDSHLAGCDSCRVGMEAMAEAGVSYRAWTPVAVAPWLFRETMAKAAELVGADWSEEIAAREARRNPLRRRAGALAAGLGALLLLFAGVTAVLGDDDPPAPAEPAPAEPARAAAPAASAPPSKPSAKGGKPKQAKSAKQPNQGQSTGETPAASPPSPVPSGAAAAGAPNDPTGKPKRTGGRAAVRAPRPASTPERAPKPKPPPAPAPPAVPPPVEEPPTAEEPPEDPPTEPTEPEEPPREPPRDPKYPGTPIR
jgi:RNA polymerase sigma factor (sigma-70 family)